MKTREASELGFDADRLSRVRRAIERDIDGNRCHGVALRVARGGDVVLDVLEGYADRKAGKRLGRDAVFVTMSVAKQFTNVLALSLVERGLLRMHAPVAEWIPEFGALGKEKVNLFHLLTHTSGVQSSIPMVPPDVLTSIEKLVAYACGQPLESLPGERVNYSILLAHAVIAALCLRADGRGRGYAQMLEEDLFRPLGMRETSLGVRADLAPRVCPVRAAYAGGPALISPEALEGVGALLQAPGCEIPGGGCVTTLDDLHRFAEMLRRGGELDGVRILSPAMIDFATQIQTGSLRNVLFDVFASYRGWGYYPANIGAGFFIRGEGNIPGLFGVLNSPRTFGGFGAGSTGFWVDPAHDLTFAFLSTGLMEDSVHFERVGMLADLVVSSIVR
jgi:CubicO group peptidase (beta-lactamase class C family)